MTKACYVGVAGKARKVKKIYVGVANKARKVKKAYVGVGGKARPFFSAEAKLSYYGTVTPLSKAAGYLAATTVGNYALFGGGESGGGSIVDAYSGAIVRSTPTPLSEERGNLAATTVGNYALFGGGFTTSTVDAYTAEGGGNEPKPPEPLEPPEPPEPDKPEDLHHKKPGQHSGGDR